MRIFRHVAPFALLTFALFALLMLRACAPVETAFAACR